MFNPAELSKHAAVVFVSTTGNVLPLPSHAPPSEGYIRAGGGWVGAHAASDVGTAVRNGWPWFVGLVGAAFQGHTRTHVWAAAPVPGTIYEGPLADAPADAESFGTTLKYTSWEPALVDVEDVNSPATRGWGQRRTFVDEWYGFRTNPAARCTCWRRSTRAATTPSRATWATAQPTTRSRGARTTTVAAPCTRVSVTRPPHGRTRSSSPHMEGAIEMAAGVAPFDCAP